MNNVAKFNTTSGVWSALGVGGGNGVDGSVHVFAVSEDDLYMGGNSSRANVGGMSIVANNVVKFNTLSTTWSVLGTGNGVDYAVRALVVSGSDVYVGGSFINVGNVSANNVAKFDTLTNNWSALGTGDGNGVYGIVFDLAVSGSDLYVGGGFTTVNVGGTPFYANNIAKVNTTTGLWSGVGTSDGNGVDGQVRALAVSGSDLYVGGSFTIAISGTTIVGANNIAKVDTTTGTWSALGMGGGNGVSGQVNALAVSGGNLYVGGFFKMANVGGMAVSANSIARVDTTTGTWSALGIGGGNGVDYDVSALAVSGRNLYVGGSFRIANVGGTSISANNIAKVDTTTGTWSALGTGGGNGVSSQVNALAVSGSNLYVGGAFMMANVGGIPVSANRVVKFSPATGIWSTLADMGGGDGASGTVNDLGGSGSSLYVGGEFSFVGDNKISRGIGRFCVTNSPPTILPFAQFLVAGNRMQNLQIAIADDADQAANALTININGGSSATVNGITVSGISVNAAGQVTANVSAASNATTANFTLRVTDSAGAFAEAILTVTAVNLSGSVSDPLVCTGTGNKVSATLVLGNPNGAPLSVNNTTTFTNLIGVPGSCTVTPNVGTCTVTNANLTYAATLAANQTVTITYLTQVADNVSPATQVCTNNSASFGGGAPIDLQICGTVNCPAAGPGLALNAASPMNDQRAGSVLIYNVYTSATDPTRQNTRLSITNSDPARRANVHLFFVDGASCSVADSYLCLTPNQTTSFLASDLDPGTTGYVIAVATDAGGCPINFNSLIGDEYVKFASGHAANLAAQAITALAGGLPFCDQNASTATLSFDGVSYATVPRVLALDNLSSRADGNDTLLIVNRIGGNLAIGASTLGTLFGILYNDSESALSFSLNGSCQLRGSLTNSFPRTTPRFEQFVPAGRSGWMKFYSQSDIGMTGAAINFNANAGANANAFNQGHNLHGLTLTTGASYTIPVFPPNC